MLQLSLWLVMCSVCQYSFASAKKCTNEGRALMQLDFQQFLNKLEKLTDLRLVDNLSLHKIWTRMSVMMMMMMTVIALQYCVLVT